MGGRKNPICHHLRRQVLRSMMVNPALHTKLLTLPPIAFKAYLAFAAPDNPLSRNASLCPSTRLSARQPRRMRPTPGQVRLPSSSQPCGSTTARHRVAARQGAGVIYRADQASGSSPMRRCADANRPAHPVLRHCNARAIVRSIARQTPSLPTHIPATGDEETTSFTAFGAGQIRQP
jgi:hypothetical protein